MVSECPDQPTEDRGYCVITKEYREAAFRRELEELFEAWGAEWEITDDAKSYGMHSPIFRIYIDGVYDHNECVAEFTGFDL
jgi:hypothetical protein